MAEEKQRTNEPRGFGEHVRGLASELAHEQGWGLNEEERKKTSPVPQDIDGGTDYEYGARDFGDEPSNTARVGGTDGQAEEQTRRSLGVNRERRSA